jgi:hypothetical protein
LETSPTFMLDRDYSKFTTKEKISLLRELYRCLFRILEACFTGYLMIADEQLNLYYIRICLLIERILASEETGPIRDLCGKYQRPFGSLFSDWGDGDVIWEYGNKTMMEFMGEMDEAFVELGEPKFVDLVTSKFLSDVDSYLAFYASNKKAKEARWIKNVEKQTEKFREESQATTEPERPRKGRLGFIKD